MPRTLLYTHPDCLEHRMQARHPECPARLVNLLDYLNATGMLSQLDTRAPEPAPNAAISAIHDRRYLDMLDAAVPADGLVRADPDTAMGPKSLHAARRAAGALIDATHAVLAGEAARAFCAIRPPGHHAEESAAMGFCFYNNIALGAATALLDDAIERVAILDFDVHHGNGSIDIFKAQPNVLVCSSFQHPLYPDRYVDLDRPNIVNTPLAAGTDGAGFRRAIERDWIPAVEAHQPQLIFVSAGFDAHRADPLGGLLLEDADYAWVTRLICDFARQFAGGRVISALEGGYDLDALARSAAAHIGVLLEN